MSLSVVGAEACDVTFGVRSEMSDSEVGARSPNKMTSSEQRGSRACRRVFGTALVDLPSKFTAGGDIVARENHKMQGAIFV